MVTSVCFLIVHAFKSCLFGHLSVYEPNPSFDLVSWSFESKFMISVLRGSRTTTSFSSCHISLALFDLDSFSPLSVMLPTDSPPLQRAMLALAKSSSHPQRCHLPSFPFPFTYSNIRIRDVAYRSLQLCRIHPPPTQKPPLDSEDRPLYSCGVSEGSNVSRLTEARFKSYYRKLVLTALCGERLVAVRFPHKSPINSMTSASCGRMMVFRP